MKNYTHDDFRFALSAKFPGLRDRISEDENLGVYDNCTLLANLINEALMTGNSIEIKSAMELAVEFYGSGNTQLASGFECDFFEVLDLRNPRGKKLFKSFTTKFKEAYLHAQSYINTPYDPDAEY